MSIASFESLPNELHRYLFERYVNGVDIVLNINHQLNSRITGLVNSSQRFRFDFSRCRKDEFAFCLGLLPAYVDKIEILTLSDHLTPGQLQSFLQSKASRSEFSHLRTLNLNIDFSCVNSPLILNFIHRCQNFTVLENISIRCTELQDEDSMVTILRTIYQMKNLRSLCIESNNFFNFDASNATFDKIEKLTLVNSRMKLHSLSNIIERFPKLTYLNLVSSFENFSRWERLSKELSDIKAMNLRTCYLDINGEVSENYSKILCDFLQRTPNLENLQLKLSATILRVAQWQNLFNEGHLKFLKKCSIIGLTNELNSELAHLFSEMGTFALQTEPDDNDINEDKQVLINIINNFKNAWPEKPMFRFYLIPRPEMRNREIVPISQDTIYTSEQDFPIENCFILPIRNQPNIKQTVNEFRKLCLTDKFLLEHSNIYFDEVKDLYLSTRKFTSFAMISNFVNLETIHHCTIASGIRDNNEFFELFRAMKNLQSLTVHHDIFHRHTVMQPSIFHSMETTNAPANYPNVKYLEILVKEKIKKSNLVNFATLFPNIEHLKILECDTTEFIRSLRQIFPRLNSLTIFGQAVFPSFTRRRGNGWRIHQASSFCFRTTDDYITIWIDENALNDRFWSNAQKSRRMYGGFFFSDEDDD